MVRLSGALGSVSNYWDDFTAAWLDGETVLPDELAPWFNAYRGKGAGEVESEALPELWHGPLTPATCRGVFLALNPGRADLGFQGRHGIFAQEIRTTYGSYTRWAASWPYLRAPWDDVKPPNRHHRLRLAFLRRWHADEALPSEAMTSFELYPWHSARVTGTMRPDPDLVRHFVLDPVAELNAPVFAIGAPWFPLLEQQLRLRVIDRLGAGGRDYGSRVASRAVAVFELRKDVPIIAMKHAAPAVPPDRDETFLLRRQLNYLG